jgi:uncharacterized membrane protein YphA (DoxX/SURF4 family)
VTVGAANPQVGPLVLELDPAPATAAIAALAPLAALATSAVFAVAAVTKLAAPARTTREFADLGLPAPALLARLVPAVELAIAVALVLRPAIGAVAATAALLAFTGVLVAALRSGRSVSCGCLGALSDGPISNATIARNAGLVVVAVLAGTAPDPGGLLPALPSLEVALSAGSAVTVAAVAAQLALLRHRIGRIWSVELAGEAGRSGPSGPHPSPPPHSPIHNRHLEAPAS